VGKARLLLFRGEDLPASQSSSLVSFVNAPGQFHFEIALAAAGADVRPGIKGKLS
jgi:hypothetical protein